MLFCCVCCVVVAVVLLLCCCCCCVVVAVVLWLQLCCGCCCVVVVVVGLDSAGPPSTGPPSAGPPKISLDCFFPAQGSHSACCGRCFQPFFRTSGLPQRSCCGLCFQPFFPASGLPQRLPWVLFSTDFLCAALTVYLLLFSCSRVLCRVVTAVLPHL